MKWARRAGCYKGKANFQALNTGQVRSGQVGSGQVRSGQVRSGHTHSLTAVGALGYVPPPPPVLCHPHADRHRLSDPNSHISAPVPPRSTSSSPTLHTTAHDRVGQSSRPPRHVSKQLQLSFLYRVEQRFEFSTLPPYLF